MNTESKKPESVNGKSDNQKQPERQRKEFVKPELKSWGSVDKVTGFTF